MLHKAIIGVLCLGLGGLTPSIASAAPTPKAATHASLNLTELKKALESGDEDRALAALEEIEQAGGNAGGAPLVEGVLSRGASSKLLLRAIAVAGSLGKESSSAALAPYVKHRAADVRHAAAVSLTRTKGKVAVQALRDALRGSDGALRGTAADGLGSLGAKEAVPDLFVVLPKEVPEAAGAIGTLCTGDECKKFLDFLGKLPFDTMQSGFLPILLRTGSDVPDNLKLDLIERLRRMATPKTNEVLGTALATYPAGGSPKVKAALDAALHGHSVKSDEP
jgi:hypothetical protein